MAGTRTKKREKERNLDLHKNQVRLNRILDVLGVRELHKKLHNDFRAEILKYPDPPLVMEYMGNEVPRNVENALGRWKSLTYKGISSDDFMEVMHPLVRHMNSATGCRVMAGEEKMPKEFSDQYLKPANEFLDYFIDKLQGLVQIAIWDETSPDKHYLHAQTMVEKLSRHRMRFRIRIEEIPFKSSWIGGKWHYRLGSYYRTLFQPYPEMKWLSRCPLDYGLPGTEDERLPVYVTKHALDRMRDRLDTDLVKTIAMFLVYNSLDKPVVYPLNDGTGDMLVEHRVKEPNTKVGYFVVSRTDKEILVKTFLFITMYQTPEGNQLYRRLRMARPDYDFHKLERVSTFMNSDITKHPTLRALWEACGFGGFLELVDRGIRVFATEQKQVADGMVKYFQLEKQSSRS
jgi:hypothetical protein